MLATLLLRSRAKAVPMLQQLLREYLQKDPDRRPHKLSDEKVLEMMLTKIYKGAVHREYAPGETLGEFVWACEE